MAQGKTPRNPLAFASVLYPGRCLTVEPAAPKGRPSWLRVPTGLFHPVFSAFPLAPWRFEPTLRVCSSIGAVGAIARAAATAL